MGFFGAYLFDGTGWRELQPGTEVPPPPEPWLFLDIHDSDICTVRYAPAGAGTGEAYVGFTPRAYFESDAASAPTNSEKEAAGLAAWWAQMQPVRSRFGFLRTRRGDPDTTRAKAVVLAGFLAEDIDPSDEPDEDAELDDADVFVEVKVRRFLEALGLPVPDGLPGGPGVASN